MWPHHGVKSHGVRTRALRADVLGTPARVTDVEPGLAETEFPLVRFKGDQERASSLYKGAAPLTPEDIADTVHWVANRPPHVNINTIEMMPTCQAFAALAVARNGGVKSKSKSDLAQPLSRIALK